MMSTTDEAELASIWADATTLHDFIAKRAYDLAQSPEAHRRLERETGKLIPGFIRLELNSQPRDADQAKTDTLNDLSMLHIVRVRNVAVY